MKKKHFLPLLLTGSLLMIYSCGSFQGMSYYSADGIYNPQGNFSTPTTEVVIQDNNTQYYKNYFREAGQDFQDLSGQSTETFTDVETYVSNTQNPQQTQQMWGANPSKTNVYVYNNTNPYAFNYYRSYGFVNPWLWDDFYFGPSPLDYRFRWGNRFRYGNRFRFGNRFSYWGGGFYDPFFGPWDPYNSWGYGWGWSQPYRYWDRYNRYNGFSPWNQGPDRSRETRRSYSRVNSNRGANTPTNRTSRQSAISSLGGGSIEVPQLSNRSDSANGIRIINGRSRPSSGENSSNASPELIKSRSAADAQRSPKTVERNRPQTSRIDQTANLSRAQQQYLNRKMKEQSSSIRNTRSSRSNSNRSSNTYRNSSNSNTNYSTSRSRSYSAPSRSSSYRGSSGGGGSSSSRGTVTAGRSRGGGR